MFHCSFLIPDRKEAERDINDLVFLNRMNLVYLRKLSDKRETEGLYSALSSYQDNICQA